MAPRNRPIPNPTVQLLNVASAFWNTGIKGFQDEALKIYRGVTGRDVSARSSAPTAQDVQRALDRQRQARRARINTQYGTAAPRPDPGWEGVFRNPSATPAATPAAGRVTLETVPQGGNQLWLPLTYPPGTIRYAPGGTPLRRVSSGTVFSPTGKIRTQETITTPVYNLPVGPYPANTADMSLEEALRRGFVTGGDVTGQVYPFPRSLSLSRISPDLVSPVSTSAARGGLNVRNAAALLGGGGLVTAGGATYFLTRNNTAIPVKPDGTLDVRAASELAFPGGNQTKQPPSRDLAPGRSRQPSSRGGRTGVTAPAVISTNDADSEYNQVLQNALAGAVYAPDRGSFSNIGDYYSARQVYASQPDVAANTLEKLIERDPRFADRTTLGGWAGNFPALAYELSQQYATKDISQQMPQTTVATPMSELGSNPVNNAAAPAIPDSDLRQAAQPQIRPYLLPEPPPSTPVRTAMEFPGGDTELTNKMLRFAQSRRPFGEDYVDAPMNGLGSRVGDLGYFTGA